MASAPTDYDLLRLAERVGRALMRAGATLVTAESCTGGWVAQAVTAIAGSSAWFDRGFVTYSNAAKSEMLGVPEALIRDHGAVSEPVARAMAEGALVRTGADVAVAVSGIAGPGGGSPEKPVGTVCFGWGRRGSAIMTDTVVFAGDREAVRRQTVAHALQELLKMLGAN